MAAALLAMASVGCGSSDTGIVLVIGLAPDAPAPAEVVVMVGSEVPAPEAPVATWHDGASDRFSLEGRDLAAEPLRYLIRPGSRGGQVQVAVAGLVPAAGEEPAQSLTAHYPEPLKFHDGVILEVPLALSATAEDEFQECSRCFRHRLEPGFQVVSDYDRDCDGSRAEEPPECAERDPFRPADCDDQNPARSPSRIESCDGIDNNCDDSTDDYAVGCFSGELECRFGAQVCVDQSAEWQACIAEEDGLVPTDLCTTWAACGESRAPLECFVDGIGKKEYLCRVEVAAEDGFRTCGSGVVHSFEPTCDTLFVMGIQGDADFRGIELGGALIQSFASLPCEGVLEPIGMVMAADRLARPARVTVLEVGDADRLAHVFHFEPHYVGSCSGESAPSCDPL